MRMGDLTKAQIKCLLAASREGGKVGFGIDYKVVGPLQKLGLLEPIPGKWGYRRLTDAGRAALRKSQGER